jgi:exodeoxyribonuclease-1
LIKLVESDLPETDFALYCGQSFLLADDILAATFYFHDYETWGADPKKDRPAQFAGVRTDLALNPLAEAQMWYCQLAPDYLPHPVAALITGLTPQLCNQKGLPEVQFMQRILHEFSTAETCVVGYNNLRFDDEVTRYSLWRNFLDPYGREWQQGNSRWDLIDVVRACYALRPDGIQWPLHDNGQPSFRLEDLTKANGLEHQHAHDARSDVYATIAIAKLVQQAQPKLFQYLYEHRKKQQVQSLIDVAGMTPLVHVSSKFPAMQGCCSWIVPLAFHPTNKNAVICFNLQSDPRILADLTIEQLNERLYRRNSDLAEDEPRPGLKLVHLNKCPVLANAKTLSETRAAELGIDRKACLANLEWLKQNRQLQKKVVELYQTGTEFKAETNPDYQLYQGFTSDQDKQLMQRLHQLAPEALQGNAMQFQDDRLNQLLFRFRARNYPHSLTFDELQKWRRYCHDKLTLGVDNPSLTLDEFTVALENAAEQVHDNKQKMAILQALFRLVSEQ